MHIVSRFILAAIVSIAATTASAQTCAGFTDVAPGSLFCDNIQWIKNRGVTQGCGAGLYCPADSALRDQMAAFMNRLGRALTPEVLFAQADSGAIVLPGDPPASPQFRCMTADTTVQVAPVQYARQVSVTGVVSGLADPNGASWRAFAQVSTDGGATWNDLNPGTSVAIRQTSSPNLWSSAGVSERMDLAPGVTYRFALGLRRDNVIASAGNLTQSRCQLAATIVNRNPATPPF